MITHEAGETQVCGRPQKVATLGPSLLELSLTLETQPIGHAEYFPFPTERFDQPSEQIPYLGQRMTGQPFNVGTAESPSLDAIAKLKPDLILGDITKNKDEYALLSKIAPTLLFDYSGAETTWQSDLKALGQALQKSQKAEAVIAESEQRLAKLKQDFKPLVTRQPNVLLLLSEQINQGVRIETPNSSCGALLEEVGFQVLVPSELAQSDQDSHVISLEALPELKADWILIEGFNSDITAKARSPEERQLQTVRKTWEGDAIAQSLPASKEGKVYFTTVYLCHALLGPLGTDLFLSDLRQQLSR
ncbi:Fe(3+)-citrate-binding protein YfmC [Acaryochloris thomasi RCC1774]|uniref:Fe(3+)-citrate-binding protein YfmC n=2 Tax=Acaryochloris TaxID=155977 RepID=A0A2W1JME4_9CYAN|nr:Fe(3+)-citrate-binding protein YfmC [Acaryochloris thomasi RCC1774]